MALPTFVIGGAPKCGTTALSGWLSGHPDVWMSPIAEPHFLTRQVNDPAAGVTIAGPPRHDTFRRGLAWYESLFDGGTRHAARGEASTHYLAAEDTPDVIRELVPALKVVFVLRDPIDRAYSHYWHGIKRGWQLPSFDAIVDDDPALRYLLHVSHYAVHLDRYRGALGDDHVCVLLFDDLRNDPMRVWSDLCGFIGVDPDHVPDFHVVRNPHAAPAHRGLHRLIGRTKYARWPVIPKRVRKLTRRFRDRAEAWNLRPAEYPPLDARLRDRLYERFVADIEYVERLTRPLPAWHSRSGAES
jgi:hypothetical protein